MLGKAKAAIKNQLAKIKQGQAPSAPAMREEMMPDTVKNLRTKILGGKRKAKPIA